MSTVIENIDSLFSVKSDIRQAIVDKGVDMTSVPFTSFAAKIGEISTGSDPNLIEVSVLQGEQTQEVIPEWYGDDVDGFTKVRITLDPSLPDTYKTQALNELTEATATEEDVAQGQKYYDNKGVLKTGTMQGGGGDTDIEDALINGTLSGTYTNARVTLLRPGAFEYCSITSGNFPNVTKIGESVFANCIRLETILIPKLQSSIANFAFFACKISNIDFPNVTFIGESAFGYCSSLTNVSFPACTSISKSAFVYCSKLTTASFPACTSIGSAAFGYCSSLTTADFPACTFIDDAAFYSCSSLTTASFPACTSIGSAAFGYCRSLTSVDFPVCQRIGTSAFGYCTALTSVDFPVCTFISNYVFYNCSALTRADFPLCTTISNSAFYGCSSLSALYLNEVSSVTNLRNSAVFNNTPMKDSSYLGYYGSIYVPMSLVDQFKTKTNWTYYADRIVGV